MHHLALNNKNTFLDVYTLRLLLWHKYGRKKYSPQHWSTLSL